jgi:oligogalacturonide lyase
VYFMKVRDQRVYLANVQTGELRVIAELPARANIETANADDTLLAGTYVDSSGPDYSEVALPPGVRPTPAARMTQRVESKLPMVLFTLDLRTKAINPILHSTDWISHLQFSPKDPSLLMYCHEGLWQDVDRIWTIHTDGTANTLIHKRTQEMEIAGHEFWDADGKTIWYDLQVPKGQTFFLASYNTESGQRMRYQVDRNSWSIHFNVSKDGKLFCGDGGDSGQVAGAEDGEWIELFHPQPLSTSAQEGNASIGTGILVPEHLVNMSKHDYKVEPNVRFTPDNKWVIFASNMLGANYVFAVETELAQTPTGQ